MATLIFAHAKSIRKKALREINKIPFEYDSNGYPIFNPESTANAYNSVIEKERREFREILKVAKLLHDDYQEIAGNSTYNWYFITIRPKPGVDFLEFVKLVHKYVNRAFVLEYKLTFEQKDPQGSGEGFHAHIVANTKHRSKGECLRDTLSTFNSIAEPQCIDIKPTRNPGEMFQKYCIEYKSDDNHKESTKEGDDIWRQRIGLKAFYDTNDQLTDLNDLRCPIKSGRTAPVILELN